MWRRANMTPMKLAIIILLIAICTVLAWGSNIGLDQAANSGM
jgi:hypothetical protein